MGSQQLIIRTLLALGSVWFAFAAHAQPGQHTQNAIQRYQAGDLMAARGSILQAIQSPKEKEKAYTWYVKGFIYKEIYKEIDKGNANSENREIAVEAIVRSMQLNASGGDAETAENNAKALSFLALSYYNDAVLMTRSLSPAKVNAPEKSYNRYKDLLVKVEPQKDFTPQDVEFYKNMARGCRMIYDRDPDTHRVYFDLSNTYYQRAIELAPNDFQANYNLAVNYYNQGVHKIRRIDHNTEIFELIQIQDECVGLFKLALPYMRKAHDLQPEHRKTLGGLMAIYRSLSDDDQAALFQMQLETLIKKGNLRD